jgi:Tfp pilus assembly protein PilF
MRRFGTALLLFLACVSAVSAGQPSDELNRRQALQHYRNGQELMFAERWEKAEREFAAAIQLDPLLTLAHYGLGQSYMAQKRYASAVRAFLGCRDAYLKIFALRQKDALLADRRTDEEVRELRDAIAMVRAGRVKGWGEARLWQLENRVEELERLRITNVGRPQTPAELALALGSAYFRNGQAEDAEREWKAAVAVNSKMGEAHNNLAVLYMMRGRKKEAEDAIKAAERSGFRVNPNLKADVRNMSEQ